MKCITNSQKSNPTKQLFFVDKEKQELPSWETIQMDQQAN